MKRILLLLAPMLLPALPAAAGKPAVESGHSLSLSLYAPGIGYSYEQALARRFTIVGSAELALNLWYVSWYEDAWQCDLHPVLSLEPRFYYSLDRRAERGRNAAHNSASYLALKTSYIFGPVFTTAKGLEYNSFASLSPTWGMRRVWGDHWLFEFNTGLTFAFNSYGTAWGINLGLRFGYRF